MPAEMAPARRLWWARSSEPGQVPQRLRERHEPVVRHVELREGPAEAPQRARQRRELVLGRVQDGEAAAAPAGEKRLGQALELVALEPELRERRQARPVALKAASGKAEPVVAEVEGHEVLQRSERRADEPGGCCAP